MVRPNLTSRMINQTDTASGHELGILTVVTCVVKPRPDFIGLVMAQDVQMVN